MRLLTHRLLIKLGLPFGPAIEGLAMLVFVALQAFIDSLFSVPVDWLIRIDTLFLLVILLAAWNRFHGGMHICFFFLGTLLVFQAGRLLAFTFNPLFGNDPELRDPFRFVLMRQIPFDVGRQVPEMTLLMIITSAVFIYLPCSISYVPGRMPGTLSPRLMRGLYRLYLAAYPFLLYKNVHYFLFIRNHGGYLALFLMRDELLNSVNIIIRIISLVASVTFIAIFLFERSRSRLYLVTTSYFISSLFDLLTGMRGKVFTFLLTLWFLHNLKRGKRFRIYRVMISGVLLAYVAMFAANFRENVDRQLLSPLGFLASQGISMQVTEAVVGYRNDFVRNPYMYLVHEVGDNIFSQGSQVDQPNGESLAGDLTSYLSLRASAEGYGSGSAYIAEAFLFSGILGVICVSFIIGCVFSWMHGSSGSIVGGLLLAYMMPSLIYLPRSTLLDPVVLAVKTFAAIVLLFPVVLVIARLPKLTLRRSTTQYEG